MKNLDLIRSALNQASLQFKTADVLHKEIAFRLIERLDLFKIKPKTILNIGARTGDESHQLAKYYPRARIIGIDIADKMLKTAASQKKWLSKEAFICADTDYLPLKDESVDFIFSNLALHWHDSLALTFKEWFRVLKKDGVILFSTFGPDTLKELKHSWESIDTFNHVNSFLDMHDIGDLLLHTNFTDPVMDMDYLTLTYPTLDKLLSELKAVGSCNLSENKQTCLTGKHAIKKLEKAYHPFLTQSQYYPLTVEIVYGHAWKLSTMKKQVSQHDEVRIPVSQLKTRR